MNHVIGWVNQPSIKEGLKLATGIISFGLGVESLYQLFQERVYSNSLERYTCALAQFSFVLQGAVTPIGRWMTGSIVHCLWSRAQLEKVFGVSGVFDTNWLHPRHVISLLTREINR